MCRDFEVKCPILWVLFDLISCVNLAKKRPSKSRRMVFEFVLNTNIPVDTLLLCKFT